MADFANRFFSRNKEKKEKDKKVLSSSAATRVIEKGWIMIPVVWVGGRCQRRRPDLRRRSNRHDPSCHSNRPPRPTAKRKKEKEKETN